MSMTDPIDQKATTSTRARAAAHPAFAAMRLPLIAAPMFLVTGPELVLAACKAGIMGVSASGSARSPAEYDEWLHRYREELAAFGRDAGRTPGPWAANLAVGRRGHSDASRLEANLESCRRTRPPVVITVNGSPAAIVPEVHRWGGLVLHDVASVGHARKAAAAGVDGLILICGGGGGHSGLLNPFAFVSAVRSFFDGIVVLAGAIGTGREIAAAQVLGADLAYMGTRFIATRESRAPERYKRMLVESDIEDLVYTPAFTRGVPAMMLTRSIRATGYDPAALPAPKADGSYLAGATPWTQVWSAGQSVAGIRDIPTVAQLVERLQTDYVTASQDRADRWPLDRSFVNA